MSRGVSFGRDRRGVSEALGYVLVFSIVVGTVGTTMVVGFSGLEDRQSVEQVTNVERAFDVLAENLDDMGRYEDPSRATEIRLAGGTLSLGEEVNMTVGRWDDGSDDFVDGNETNETATLRPLVYESDGGRVVYEAGMVFRGDGETSLARTETPFVVEEETTAVSTVVTDRESSTTGITSDRSVLVEADREPNPPQDDLTRRTIAADGEELWIEIESPRADGWARQLREEGFQDVSTNDERVTARLAVEDDDGSVTESEEATLVVTRIDIGFSR